MIMAARKRTVPTPAPTEPPAPVGADVVSPLAELDPLDGRPVFAEGLSRRRWLDAHADERKAAQLEHLLADPGESDDLGDA